MKKYSLIVLVSLIGLLGGCNDSVTPKKILGVWEVYDSSDAGYVGNKHTYFPDGRRLIKGVWDSGYDIYELDSNNLTIFKNKEVQKEKQGRLYKIYLKGNILEISNDNQTPPYWVKLKKISELD